MGDNKEKFLSFKEKQAIFAKRLEAKQQKPEKISFDNYQKDSGVWGVKMKAVSSMVMNMKVEEGNKENEKGEKKNEDNCFGRKSESNGQDVSSMKCDDKDKWFHSQVMNIKRDFVMERKDDTNKDKVICHRDNIKEQEKNTNVVDNKKEEIQIKNQNEKEEEEVQQHNQIEKEDEPQHQQQQGQEEQIEQEQEQYQNEEQNKDNEEYEEQIENKEEEEEIYQQQQDEVVEQYQNEETEVNEQYNNNLDLSKHNPQELYNSPRQYSTKNISKGRLFFKNRFIFYKTKKPSSTPQPSSLYDEYSNEEESDDDSDEETSKAPSICKNESIRKCTLQYYKLIENSIILFNNKQYQQTYELLLNNNIITSLSEFAEILFLTNGYNKEILGNFLSKTHSPNDNGQLLNMFMSLFYFNDLSFLTCFRFLFTRLILPKDSNLISVLIDKWSTYYFNAKSFTYQNPYKDINSVYSLCSSVLTLNTTLLRKDSKKHKPMSLKEFISINKNIQAQEVEQVYKELITQQLDMNPTPIDYAYKRLSHVVEECTTNTKHKNNKCIHFALSTSCDIPQDELIPLINGNTFIKFNVNNPHAEKRFVYLNEQSTQIIRYKVSSKGNNAHKKIIDISDISGVYIGTGESELYKGDKEKYRSFYDEEKYLTIKTNNGFVLDLYHEQEDVIIYWYIILRKLILKYKNEMMHKRESEINEKEKTIKTLMNTIWKKEILVNWNYYRKYIINNKQIIINRNINNDKKKTEENVSILKSLNEKFFTPKNKDTTNNNNNNNNIDTHLSNTKYIISRNEFIYIIGKGILDNIRVDMWLMLFQNPCAFNETLYTYYLNQLPHIDFNKIDNNDSPIIHTINKAKNYFINEITSSSINQIVLMNKTFQIVSAFLLHRPDIPFKKCLIYYTMMFLLNNIEQDYKAFISLISLCSQSYIMPFIINDINFITRRVEFFETVLKDKVNDVYTRLKEFELTPEFYLIKWFEMLFIKCFSYSNVKRIWDLMLLKGESVLFKIAYAIVCVHKKDILCGTYWEMLLTLQKVNDKIKEYLVMEMIEKDCEVDDMFNKWKYENELGEEKGILYKGMIEK